MSQSQIYDMITDRIIKILEQGEIPWRKSWASIGIPANFKTKRVYRGINFLMLASANRATRWWLTFNQVKELGGKVKKGERSTPVVFWKWLEKPTEEVNDNGDTENGTRRFPMVRYYNVFNLDQTEGITIPDESRNPEFSPIEQAEQIISNMPNRPEMKEGVRPVYYPIRDVVECPAAQFFDSSAEYYAAIFHEIMHSTGTEKRLNRYHSTDNDSFGSEAYSQEELVAEIGAAFLATEAGFIDDTITNHAAYVQGWLKALKNDKKMILVAAGQAQKAADYILNIQAQQEAEAA